MELLHSEHSKNQPATNSDSRRRPKQFAGPAHGAPPQNVKLAEGDHLLDHLGGGFDLLYFTRSEAVPDDLQHCVAQARSRGVALRITAIGASAPVAGADQTLPDDQQRCRLRYGIQTDGAAYLLRPDQHICARWHQVDAARLQDALSTALPR